jgi:hypothetical protein
MSCKWMQLGILVLNIGDNACKTEISAIILGTFKYDTHFSCHTFCKIAASMVNYPRQQSHFEKILSYQLVKTSIEFYGRNKFTGVFTETFHLSPS